MTLGKYLAFSIPLLMTAAVGMADWRFDAAASADRLAERIEVLDETLHVAAENHETPQFKAAIETIHHIERLVQDLKEDTLAGGSEHALCELYHHIYEDLVQIRLDLINLGVQGIPDVVNAWNNMANTFNYDLNRYYQFCANHVRLSAI